MILERGSMSRIFISYRRADSAEWAGKIFNSLSIRYGENLIFRDVDSIPLGTDYHTPIEQELASSFAILVLIGPDWLNEENRRRLHNADDVLRNEIAGALSGSGTVIPVLVGGANVPRADALPDPLKTLVSLQMLTLRDDEWGTGIDTLVERLRVLVGPTRDQIPLQEAQQELYKLQERYFKSLVADAAASLDLTKVTQKYLDTVMPLYPQDDYLKVTRGYLFKNEAMAFLDMKRKKEAVTALNEAELIFRTMTQENHNDAGAWNGLGSVEAVRGTIETNVQTRKNHYRKALGYIEIALDIDPGYSYAIEDRETIQEALSKIER
jgi:hypothetical protein